MAKKQPTTNNPTITIASVLIFLLGFKIWGWPTQMFGLRVPEVLYGVVQWWSGLILVSYAIWLWGLRKKPFKATQLLQGTLVLVAALMIVVGLKFTSYSPDKYMVQNDGYNVTGGFILLVAGFCLGYLTGRNEKRKVG